MSELLPNGWKKTTLGQIVRLRGEKRSPQLSPEAPFIGLEDVAPHTSRVIQYRRAGELKSAAACFSSAEILYGRLRPYLNKVLVADRDGLASAEFLVLQPRDDTDAEFVRRRIMMGDFLEFTAGLDKGDRPPTSEIRTKYRRSSEEFVPPFDVPSKWQWLRLPEIGDLDRGKSKHRPRNAAFLFGGPYPFVQTGEVRAAEQYLTTYSKTYNEAGLAQSRLWPAGTVCITIAANIAETAILAIDACFPDSVVGFTPDLDRTNGEFVEFFLRTERVKLAAFAPATAQKNINLDTVGSIRLPVPPLSEQQEIVRRIETAFAWPDRVATEHAHASRLLPKLDQAILAKAFRGELVPQDQNDEQVTFAAAFATEGQGRRVNSKRRRAATSN